ncbi:hypothetical protein [Novosphingobium kaempferiae]|uniref:hypothetical protein n=1 Tax=Novosphingobium kaempferiae TaxID=2896849 RepID=UPI001E37FE68|nr:hypothetical protein [Novosphingobium kaempferiae]
MNDVELASSVTALVSDAIDIGGTFGGGGRTNLDALDAERQGLEAQRDLARAWYDYLLAWLSLRWQAGTHE